MLPPLHIDDNGKGVHCAGVMLRAARSTRALPAARSTGVLLVCTTTAPRCRMLDNANLACDWLMQTGFSSGRGDLFADDAR
jgi:hypothetical protein